MCPTLILASASPRRQHLLQALGIPFRVEVADIDESVRPRELPADYVRRLALHKARAVAAHLPQDVVLAADTIVVQQDRILGKPKNADEARRMLQSLRSLPHEVLTAVAVSCRQFQRTRVQVHRNRVFMRPYSDAEITAYIATGDPMDKAGAYAIQHPQFRPVARFEGCFASIMGLPLMVVADLLTQFDLYSQTGWPQHCHRLTGHCCQLT